ncbi:hypothetical protein DA798_01815 [Lactobacillus sp. PFC-70]|nr:hypothetical protein DA798_01815 [Lactobacillus sp. PFC-70]
MRLIHPILVAGLSVLALGLTGCQNTAQKSSTSFKNQEASSKKYQAPKPDAAFSASSSAKIAQSFKPNAAQTKGRGYVKSGNLQQPGQYTYDRVGTKLTLDQAHTRKHTIKRGPLTYRITLVRTIANTAETANAKKMAAQALNLPSIKSPYYTVQVKFTILNRGKRAVTTDGIREIRLSNGHRLSATNQLSDASAGRTIGAHRQLATFATGLASQGKAPKLDTLKIAFAGGYDQKQHQLVKPSGWLTIHL